MKNNYLEIERGIHIRKSIQYKIVTVEKYLGKGYTVTTRFRGFPVSLEDDLISFKDGEIVYQETRNNGKHRKGIFNKDHETDTGPWR